MGIELATEKWLDKQDDSALLGQFASTKGYSDLIRVVTADKKLYPLTCLFFKHGATAEVPKVEAELRALAVQHVNVDIVHTAKGLADLMHGHELVIITNGAN